MVNGIDIRPDERTAASRIPVARTAATFWLKGCPRCRGDLVSESDMYEAYVSCMQCGFYLTDVRGSAPSLASGS